VYTALRATSCTITHYLLDRFTADPLLGTSFGGGGTMQVSLLSPPQMTEAHVQGLSVWMYRVVRDEDRLNTPARRIGWDVKSPPPLPLRVHFLMTPLSGETTNHGRETEQVILGKVLQALHDHPILRGSDLRDDFRGTETVLHARPEPLALQEIYDIWDALEGSYPLSVSYEVSVVNIDPALEPTPVSPVTVVLPEYAQIVVAAGP
jgi:hypothetical protein